MDLEFWELFLLLLFLIPATMLWVAAIIDIFRRDDISGAIKALWVAVVIFMPILGTIVYLLLRKPGGTPEERVAVEAANREFVAEYAPEVGSAAQLKLLADLHTAGKLTDDEFAAEKAKITGTPSA